ncbi:MAG: outer membrane lipoprotein-sorting protein [Chitinispirillaceae bacterium]|nr:outer membrane lipoprotein-sorting protein [Chitinispirillaceae bacterium]
MQCLLLSIVLAATFTSAAPPIDTLLERLDYLYRQVSDIKAVVTLTQQKAGQGAKKFETIYYRRDSDESFLIVMTGPEAEKGNGYLRVGDNFWMYRKNTRTFQHINRDESIGGSDAHGDDFEGRLLTEMYEPAKDDNGSDIIGEEMLGKIPVYRFEVKAKVNDVDYPKKVYWVRKDETVMLKEASYSASGTLMQTAYFLSFTKIRGKLVPVKQLYVDEFEKGNKTIVEISGISTDKLDSRIFTKAYLENLSK